MAFVAWRTFAAGADVRAEPESGAVSGGAAVINDTSASGGKALRFSGGTTATESSFVKTNGTQFSLNGARFRFTGLNLHQAAMTVPLSTCAGWAANLDIETAMTQMGTGKEALRIFALQKYVTKNGVRDWAPMDRVVAAAKAKNVKLIPALVDQHDYCEGPYKTNTYWQSGYKTTILPGSSVPYRAYVQEITARYKNEPTIMMWELANEPYMSVSKSDQTCISSANTDFLNWAKDVSALIKTQAPNQLVAIGSGRGMCGMYGPQYKVVNALATIDACSYHDYTPVGTNYLVDSSIGLDTRTRQCKELNKPMYVGESGIAVADVPDLAARASRFDTKIAAQFALGVEGYLAWNYAQNSIYSWNIGPGDPTLNTLGKY